MKVLKFGGGILKSAKDVVKLAELLKNYKEKTVVVVSAFGKVTSMFEKFIFSDISHEIIIDEIYNFHRNIIEDLFYDNSENIINEIKLAFLFFKNDLFKTYKSIDKKYDAIVSFGENLSALIVYNYLKDENIKIKLIPAGFLIKTDSTYREARVNWKKTKKRIDKLCNFEDSNMYLTSGFIGSSKKDKTTTLGREGSDFSAAILAYCLDAEKVEFWKEVKGIYNADPNLTNDYIFLPKLSYREAVEQVYFGAKILHPKTIKPLQNKKIPIYVRPFNEPDFEGTKILDISKFDKDYFPEVPIFIVKENQILISVSPLDFSFIAEDNLKIIFSHIADLKIKTNLIQNSAISFSFSANYEKVKINKLIKRLNSEFKVKYNNNLSLITIRHYDDKAVEKMTTGKKIFLEQRSRHTVRFLLSD